MPGIEDKFGSFSATTDRDQILIRLLKELYTISGGVAPAGGLATEATLISVLNAIVASDQDIEILLVRDTGNSDEVVQQITDYTTGVPTVTYKDVNGAAYVPVGPLEYLDPSGVLNLMLAEILAQGLTLDAIDANTDGIEALLTAIDTVLDNIKLDTANLDVALSTRATEATLLSTNILLTTIDAVLDTIKTDTANLDVALSTRASEVTLLSTNVLLTTIDAVLDTIKTDTGLIATDIAAIEVLITTTNSLLTTVDAVLDTIKLDTADIVTATEAIETLLTSTVRTASLSVVSGVSVVAVPAGARSVTFYNQGPTAATIAGGVLDAGESMTFDAGGQNDTLGAIAVSTIATGVLKITKVV